MDGLDGLLHFGIDAVLEGVRGLIQSRLDQRGVLLDAQGGILVQVVEDPALALGDRLRAELLSRQLIAPIAKRAFRKLLNIALVHQRYAFAFVRERVLDGGPDKPLGPERRDWLDAYARVPANLLLAVLEHFFIQKFEQLLYFRRAGLPLDSDI